MRCDRTCPAFDGNTIAGHCKLVNAEIAKLEAEQQYYESMTKRNKKPTVVPVSKTSPQEALESKILRFLGCTTVDDVQVDEFTDMVYARINGRKREYVGQVGQF